MKKAILPILLLLSSCTTNYPVTVGTVGGGAAGAGIGAIVAKNSSSISVAEGLGYGAAIGIPTGILLAYGSDSLAKHYIISTNDALIENNQERIYRNDAYLAELRNQVMMEAPRGMPEDDNLDYIYTGPRLGNHWR